MKKVTKTILFLIASAMLLMVNSCTKNQQPDFYHEVKSVDKMVFAKMTITKTATMEDSKWYTIGKRIAIYSYDSYMRAYIDLSALQMDDIVVDETNKTVRLTLPPVITEVTGRDMQMRKEYENIGLLRSDLDSKERAEIKEKANASFKKEIEDNPVFKKQLVESAKHKARKYFETFFNANGYEASIDFKSE